MGKAKKPLWAQPLKASSKQQQLSCIKHMTETYEKHSVECFCCGERDSERDMSLADYAAGLYEEGWRYTTSKTFQTTGMLCPKCFKTPDEKRGED